MDQTCRRVSLSGALGLANDVWSGVVASVERDVASDLRWLHLPSAAPLPSHPPSALPRATVTHGPSGGSAGNVSCRRNGSRDEAGKDASSHGAGPTANGLGHCRLPRHGRTRHDTTPPMTQTVRLRQASTTDDASWSKHAGGRRQVKLPASRPPPPSAAPACWSVVISGFSSCRPRATSTSPLPSNMHIHVALPVQHAHLPPRAA